MWLERYPSGAAVGVVTTIVNAVLYAETAALRNSLSTHLEKWILGGRLEGRCTAGEMYGRGDDGATIVRTNSPSRRYGGSNDSLTLKRC